MGIFAAIVITLICSMAFAANIQMIRLGDATFEIVAYAGDHLVSRSQAKRLLARLDKFKEVYLDFKDVPAIGQAFADEIFRVFQNDHPNIRIIPVNETNEVAMMIQRALTHDAKTELPL